MALPVSAPDANSAPGILPLIVLLLPNWPEALYPHAAMLPSAQRARLWAEPAAMATTVLPAGALSNQNRDGAWQRAIVAELVLVVGAPGGHRAVVAQDEAVGPAGGDGGDCFARKDSGTVSPPRAPC